MPKRRNLKTLVKIRQKVIRRVIPFTSIPKPIPEEAKDEGDEDEEENLPLNQRTQLGRSIESERRRSSTIRWPYILDEPI